MPETLLPLGRHLFPPSYIDKLAAGLVPDPKFHVNGRAALDDEGVKVAVLFSWKEGRVVARTAIAYDWDDGLGVGADVTFKLFG